jgi:hypothetical protein
MNVRFVSRVDPDGWLEVRPSFGPNITIPYGLKLNFLDVQEGREAFEILEGPYKGTRASVRLKAPGQSYLTSTVQHRTPGAVRFELRKQALYFGGRGPFNAFSGGGHQSFTPVPPGSYQLSIPPYPARATRNAYGVWTRYHRMWFRLGTNPNGSRFLHPGAISEGCVTVRQFLYDPASPVPPPAGFDDLPQLARQYPGLLGLPLPATRSPVIGWDSVFDYLILCRLNDQSVGTLTVEP